MKTETENLMPFDANTALMGPDTPEWDGHIEQLIRYLLTVHKRFGNTKITADLQWGSLALHKRDEQKVEIADLRERDAKWRQYVLSLDPVTSEDFRVHRELEEYFFPATEKK